MLATTALSNRTDYFVFNFRERKLTEPVELENPPQKPTYGHQAFKKRFSI